MKAVITGENDERVGVNILDNNNVEHVIEMEFDGEIKYHECDPYPDKAAKRTVAENEFDNQARRYAKYYVYRERGYETVDPHRNPDRLAAVTAAVGSLDTDQFTEYFGDSFQQLESHSDRADPVVEVPAAARNEIIRVGQEIYLGADEDDLNAIVSTLSGAGIFEQLEAAAGSGGTDSPVSKLTSRLTDQNESLVDEAATISESLIDTVGPVQLRWSDGGTDHVESANGVTPDREPDAIPEMVANLYEFETIEGFQQSLVHHLRCQVRDCYIEMGIAPPEDFRVQGPGFYENVGWYENHDFYPNYYDTRATITDWQEEHTPDELLA